MRVYWWRNLLVPAFGANDLFLTQSGLRPSRRVSGPNNADSPRLGLLPGAAGTIDGGSARIDEGRSDGVCC